MQVKFIIIHLIIKFQTKHFIQLNDDILHSSGYFFLIQIKIFLKLHNPFYLLKFINRNQN